MNTIDKPPVLRVMWYLFLASIVTATLIYLLNKPWAWSIVAGSCVYLIPQTYFSVYAFRFRGARAGSLIAQSFYRGEVGKYALTMIGFGSIFSSPIEFTVPVVFVSYGACWLLGNIFIAKALNQTS